MLYFFAFLIPVLLMISILKTGHFYPFGKKTLFLMDMKGQYLEFFASLRNIASGDDSLFFSWSRSMGGNYLGLFAYYVASPLSFITVFFPLKHLTAAIALLTCLKLGLCGLSFAVYGNYIWKRTATNIHNLPENHHKTGFPVLILSVCYAMISYNMVYSLCLMWLDGVILLPAVLLGVEKILDGKRGLHYLLSLTALFICNYYTGYMVGIFTALYLAYQIFCRISMESWRQLLQRAFRFTGCTILSFGLSAPLILPVAKDLMLGKLSTETYQPDTVHNFALSELLGKLKNGVYDSITNSGLPAIYCGYLSIFLAVLFLVLHRFSLRKKIGAIFMLALLTASFYYTKLDIVWHGFQYPTWFPYRYAFLFSFFLLYLALQALCHIVCSLKWDKVRFIKPLPLLILSTLLVTLGASADMRKNGVALIAGLDQEFGYGMVEEYEAFLDRSMPLIDNIQKQDTGFYRINQYYEYSKNDAMLLGYHGMTHYSSTFHAAINELTRKLGIAQAHIWNSGYGSTPLTDSLFSVKYILKEGQLPSEYSPLETNELGVNSYCNDSSLPIAYSTPAATLQPSLNDTDPFLNQNALCNAIAGTAQSYFTELAYTSEALGNTYLFHFTAETTDPVYLNIQNDSYCSATVLVNDSYVGNYCTTETNCNLYLGSFTPGQNITIRLLASEEINLYNVIIADLHMDLLQETLQSLRQNGMVIQKHGNGKLSGTIHVDKNQTILTSIPYDEGWTIKIDGKKAHAVKFANTFLAVQTTAGDHEISFSYVSPGFYSGMILFFLSLIAALHPLYIRWFHQLLQKKADPN